MKHFATVCWALASVVDMAAGNWLAAFGAVCCVAYSIEVRWLRDGIKQVAQ